MKDSPTSIVAIDVGTYKIAVLIAKVHQSNQIEVIGMATKPNLGMSKGVIRNMDHVVASIKEAVASAEDMADCRVHSAWVTIPSAEIKSFNSSGSTNIAEGVVNATAIARTFESAKQSCLRPDYYLINSVPLGVEIDGQGDWVDHPLGMAAHSITSHYHLMMLPIATMQNMDKALKSAGVGVDRMMISTLATAEAALLKDEKDYGICLIDIGGGTTNIAVYLENRLILSHTLQLGGEHVTRDIAAVLQTSTENAENLKERHGCVDRTLIKPDQMVKVPGITEGTGRVISRMDLADIIIARYEDILEAVRDHLEDSGAINVLRHGVVLAGTASTIEGAAALTQKVLGLQVHLYNHPKAVDTTDEQRVNLCRAVYATASGLLMYSQGELQRHDIEENATSVNHTALFYRLFVLPWRQLMEKLRQVI